MFGGRRRHGNVSSGQDNPRGGRDGNGDMYVSYGYAEMRMAMSRDKQHERCGLNPNENSVKQTSSSFL